MTDLPPHVEPLDRAILDLLCTLPTTWSDHAAESQGSTQEEALRLLTRRGLVEQRYWIEAMMTGAACAIEMTAIVSGDGYTRLLWSEILGSVPDWVDGSGRTRGQASMRVVRGQVRLSHEGELARHDFENRTAENPSAVLAFVHRRGFFEHSPPCAPTVRVESRSVRNAAPGKSQQAALARAASPAHTGDITVNNIIQIDQAALVKQVLAELAKQAPASAPTATAGPPASSSTESVRDPGVASESGTAGRAAAEPELPDAVRRAGASLEWVRAERDDLVPQFDSKERYTRAQYDHIVAHGCESYPPDSQGRPTVPNWDTWSRYVREYLKLTDGRVNNARRGRTGRSMVRPDELGDRRSAD